VSAEKVILLLGRRDEPTDGVADYCEKLREAGLRRGFAFEPVQVAWAEKGWGASLSELRRAAAGWQGRSVLLQFTTLAWSRRGFPLRAPRILDVLRQCGVKPGVVFHDFLPLAAKGIVGQAREYCHLRVLRQLYERSDVAIFTVSLNQIPWLPQSRQKAVFIPVGANCPEVSPSVRRDPHPVKTVAVYSITGGNRASIEVADIANALKRAGQKVGPLRLVLFGRGSREAEPALRSQLNGVDVEIESLGLVTPEQVSRVLVSADVLLFVRGQISTRRGSAIAGIACGLPVICYAGPETAWPVTEAGIVAVPLGDREALAGALETVLEDAAFRNSLAERSRHAQEKYFSWSAITERFASTLGQIPVESELDLKNKQSGAMRVA
jgi:glycosyltransferase involved in cell wall biosynthesis